MRKTYFLLTLLIVSACVKSQEVVKPFEVDFHYFYGTIARHSKDISGLITDHPQGFIASYSRKTYGRHSWERAFNYPDYGYSYAYHQSGNTSLGNTHSLFGHYTFYFLNRRLITRIGQGIAYATNPFDLETNIENNAYGTRLLSATHLMLHYKQPITPRISIQTGLTLLHFSNGNVKSPNTSTNSLTFSIGMVYRDHTPIPSYIEREKNRNYAAPIHFNFSLKSGLHESDYLGLGQYPFTVVSFFADKRLGRKSSLHLGTELFLTPMFKEEIRFLSIAFPQFGVTEETDWKRIGLFLGHQFHISRYSVVTQLGYYAYYPYDFEGRVYLRAGLERTLSSHFSGSISIKSHGAKAEAIEFGIRYRL